MSLKGLCFSLQSITFNNLSVLYNFRPCHFLLLSLTSILFSVALFSLSSFIRGSRKQYSQQLRWGWTSQLVLHPLKPSSSYLTGTGDQYLSSHHPAFAFWLHVCVLTHVICIGFKPVASCLAAESYYIKLWISMLKGGDWFTDPGKASYSMLYLSDPYQFITSGVKHHSCQGSLHKSPVTLDVLSWCHVSLLLIRCSYKSKNRFFWLLRLSFDYKMFPVWLQD